VFLVSLFEVMTSLSDVGYFKCVACEFVNPIFFVFMYVTVRFRFGEIVYSVGAIDRYSHICVFI